MAIRNCCLVSVVIFDFSHSRGGGNLLMKDRRAADQYQSLARSTACAFCWIPACAGMTALMDSLS